MNKETILALIFFAIISIFMSLVFLIIHRFKVSKPKDIDENNFRVYASLHFKACFLFFTLFFLIIAVVVFDVAFWWTFATILFIIVGIIVVGLYESTFILIVQENKVTCKRFQKSKTFDFDEITEIRAIPARTKFYTGVNFEVYKGETRLFTFNDELMNYKAFIEVIKKHNGEEVFNDTFIN